MRKSGALGALAVLFSVVCSCGGTDAGSTSHSAGGSSQGGGAPVNPYADDADIDYSTYDPSIDPGVDPVFETDPDLSKAETYTYVFTQPGDHALPAGVCPLQYDVAGAATLGAVLGEEKDAMAACTGLAIYLVNGTALSDADLRSIQTLNKPEAEGGLGLTQLDTLHVYNLKSLQGGVECTPESGLACAGQTALGNPHPYLWDNGWAGSWVKHLVLDDVEEVKDGTFCDTSFKTLSLRGARSIGVMAFGNGPHSDLAMVYLPSATSIGKHAFRRNQYLIKVNLPKVETIDDYAFDDNSRLEYFNAPELRTIGRNAWNDTHALKSLNVPKLEKIGVNCFDLNDQLKILRLPSLLYVADNGMIGLHVVKHLYMPEVTTLRAGAASYCGNLQAVYAPKLETVYPSVFTGDVALKRIDLPSLRALDNGTFSGDTALEDVRFTRGGVDKAIRAGAFDGCGALKTLHLGEVVPWLDEDVLADTSPDLVIYYSGDDPGWASFVPKGNPSATLVKE